MMGYDKHKFGSKTTVTLAEYWYDSYLSDGTLAQIYDGSTTRLYVGDMVFTRTGTTGTPALESAAWEGGRLINGSGTRNLLYYVTDHLGSVRVVKDGALVQVARKSAFCAFCVATCRCFRPKWTVFGGRSPHRMHQWPICWRPVFNDTGTGGRKKPKDCPLGS